MQGLFIKEEGGANSQHKIRSRQHKFDSVVTKLGVKTPQLTLCQSHKKYLQKSDNNVVTKYQHLIIAAQSKNIQ